jgi:hypothetical protein
MEISKEEALKTLERYLDTCFLVDIEIMAFGYETVMNHVYPQFIKTGQNLTFVLTDKPKEHC